tara:strand:- start:3099 stop:5165 length:2067 start_codon:yes stop_codon:yes gene_type:complete
MEIPNYDVSGRRVIPQQIVDVIPEQQRSDQQIQASEERYLRELEQNEFDKAKNVKDMFGGLEKLSVSIQDLVTKRQEKYKQDREAQIKLDVLTRGVSPELEAGFRGQRDLLFQDDLATQEFASKLEAETGDHITAQEFRKMSGWERYMVAEQYALEKAKGYDQYVYDAYETVKIDVIRDGKQVSVGHYDNLSPAEQAALDTKIKFEYAKQFAGLNDTLVATVVKPEIDKFDEARRKKQAVEREANYQATVKASDSRMIAVGFSTANPEDGHELAHQWAQRYAARNRTTVGAGRMAFKENLIDLVSQNVITYPQAMSIVNHEITARDGSIKTLTSWKEWSGLPSELAAAAKQGTEAREEARENNIAADLQVVKSMTNRTDEQNAQMYKVFQSKYDGYVPTELSDALRGHIDNESAEDMIEQSIRYQGGVYDFEMENVSTEIFNKYKDKIISSGALVPGTDHYEMAEKYIKGYTNKAMVATYGEADIKSPEWLTLYGNLEAAYNRAYKDTIIKNGQVVGTHAEGHKAGRLAIEEILSDPGMVIELQTTNLEPGDDSYSRQIQTGMSQSAGGLWKKNKISVDSKARQELIAWGQTPLKQSSDIPSYYRDLAMRIGVNPIDLANSQLRFYTGDKEKVEKTEEQKYNDKILNLIYKYPTRSRITRAMLEDQGAGEQNVKTSIYNKKALVRKDQ